jgi:hypothetical protein
MNNHEELCRHWYELTLILAERCAVSAEHAAIFPNILATLSDNAVAEMMQPDAVRNAAALLKSLAESHEAIAADNRRIRGQLIERYGEVLRNDKTR